VVYIDPTSFPIETEVNSTGWVIVNQDDALGLKMLPPLHWSTAGSGEITLQATAEVIDVHPVEVYVEGVAKNQDEPEKQTTHLTLDAV
jgi:hypothetical protein